MIKSNTGATTSQPKNVSCRTTTPPITHNPQHTNETKPLKTELSSAPTTSTSVNIENANSPNSLITNGHQGNIQ